MSRPHDGQRPFFPFGNPFRMILPKGSYESPKLLRLLNSFEEALAESFIKLKPKDISDVLSLSWMHLAVESLCETHTSIKTLIAELKLPVSDWDEKWIDMYLDNSVKLLDICIAFSSELSRLNQCQLLIQYVLHVLDFSSKPISSEKLVQARSSLLEWKQQICLRTSKFENCTSVLHGLLESLNPSKVKNSARGKVLMQAMYGVMVETIYICSVFTASFTGCGKPLIALQVPNKFLWSEAFNDLKTNVNCEILKSSSGNNIMLKELKGTYGCVEKLCALTDNDVNVETESGIVQESILGLNDNSLLLSRGLDLLLKEVEGFFQIVLSGRDALLCNLRVTDLRQENSVEEHVVG